MMRGSKVGWKGSGSSSATPSLPPDRELLGEIKMMVDNESDQSDADDDGDGDDIVWQLIG